MLKNNLLYNIVDFFMRNCQMHNILMYICFVKLNNDK